MRLFFLLTLAAIALHSSGCSSMSLTPGGEKVYVVAPLSITEVAQYQDLGEMLCRDYDEEQCLRTLRNRAAEHGAYAIVVTSKGPADCFLDLEHKKQCYEMKAHAYRKKP